MSGPFAPGAVHGGWRVTGPSTDGAAHRWPVERDGRSATLTYFPAGGPRADVHRVLLERHAAWRALEHEALLRVDTGQVEGGVYVVVPPVQKVGEDALDAGAALDALERLASALTVFHDEGQVHGEVDAWSVALDDAGASLLPPGLRGPPPGLEALGLHADPRYAAPEVLDGRPATPESDVFSLGLVLYRLVTGQVPAQGAEPLDQLVARGATPAPALEAGRGVPEPVVALYRCLTARRGQRPQDARAALALVQQARKGVAPAAPGRAAAPIRPVAVSGPVLALVVIVGACVLAWSTLQSRLALPAEPFEGFQLRVGEGR